MLNYYFYNPQHIPLGLVTYNIVFEFTCNVPLIPNLIPNLGKQFCWNDCCYIYKLNIKLALASTHQASQGQTHMMAYCEHDRNNL